MNAATEGRVEGEKNRYALKSAIIWSLVILSYVGGVSLYKKARFARLAHEGLETVRIYHPKVENLFQGSFYFFYDDQFAPGIQEILRSVQNKRPGSKIERLTIYSGQDGTVLFDSQKPEIIDPGLQKQVQGLLGTAPESVKVQDPVLLTSGFSLHIFMPGAAGGVLYSLDTRALQWTVWGALLLGVLLIALARRVLFQRQPAWIGKVRERLLQWIARYWRLQLKVFAGIFVINAVAASVVFFSLVALETEQQTERIQKESVLFTQFSTAEVIADFTHFFHFYYKERFLPEMRLITATNENLLRIRIISHRNSRVLFDSEQALISEGAKPPSGKEAPQADFSADIVEQLASRDLVTAHLNRDGEKILVVINTYKNENQEPLFWVECQFTYSTLHKAIATIRRQILLDFIPSLAIGLLLAFLFARVLIHPIRRLVQALQRVAAGDYDISVEDRRTDEIGELVHAFNTMTTELKKKKELRKYLSDSTYRQIMEAPDSPGGIKIGGSRVSATVLFCDIRNFVRHCENLGAEEITTMLNEYFSEMVEVVYKYGGEVDKFIGDAFLAVFYASDEVKTFRPAESGMERYRVQTSAASTALAAIYCGMEMRERLAIFNQKRKSMNKALIEIGVGISYGEIISGPIGSKDRMDFTVIGDVVNLASRIEKLSKLGKYTKIVFSNHIEEKVRGLLEYHELATEKIRGKEEDVHVFELIGIRDIEVLVANLKSSDRELRKRSLDLLGQSRNEHALAPVLRTLKDPDEAIQIAGTVAVSKLAKRDDEQAVSALFYMIENSDSEKVISAGIATIGKICANDRIFGLVPFLESKLDRVVANAVEAIGAPPTSFCLC